MRVERANDSNSKGDRYTSTLVELFAADLYAEHLEEASFLYEQHLALLDDPELTWLDLADFEERWEAHLDALVLGEDLALAVCRQQAQEGDAGELHAAVRVFCRQQRRDLLEEVLDAVDPDDDERVQAVREALCDELPAAWNNDAVQWLGSDDELRQHLGARVAGHQRLEAGEALRMLLPEAAPDVLPDVIWALGRLREPRVRTALHNTYLRHDDVAVRRAAAMALLRIGEEAVVQYSQAQARIEPWMLTVIGLGGAGSHHRWLLDAMDKLGPSPEGLIALGLLGDPECVDGLFYYLAEPDLAEAAATGLYLLTGAGLYEEVFIPEEIDEDELFEDELEAFRQGKPPTRPDGEPYGTTMTRLTQESEVWRAWWSERSGPFQRGVRYRLGEPCTPFSVVRTLQAERLPRYVRQLAYEEGVIRYGLDAPFETTMWVEAQQRAMAALAAQAETAARTVRAGRWYVGGRPLA